MSQLHTCSRPKGLTVWSALLADRQPSVALAASARNGGVRANEFCKKWARKNDDASTHTHTQTMQPEHWYWCMHFNLHELKNFKKMKLEGDNQHSEWKKEEELQYGNVAHPTPRETFSRLWATKIWQCSLNTHISTTFSWTFASTDCFLLPDSMTTARARQHKQKKEKKNSSRQSPQRERKLCRR